MKRNFTQKLILLVFLMLSINSYSQTTNDELVQSISNLINKIGHRDVKVYKEILNETVIINSSSNARFSGGNTRAGFKINLPIGTDTWYYRITLLEPNSNYRYPYKADFYSTISNNYTFYTNNQTDYGVDFFILNDYSISNFLQTGNENFSYYGKFSRNNTRGFIGSCDLKFNNLWLGIRNPDVSHGLKVIVEVVAIGNFY